MKGTGHFEKIYIADGSLRGPQLSQDGGISFRKLALCTQRIVSIDFVAESLRHKVIDEWSSSSKALKGGVHEAGVA